MVDKNEVIENRFLELFKCKGYYIAPNYPLLTNDPTVFFVNATITPFKAAMINGDYMQDTAHIQDCFRAKFNSDFLFYFKMLGITSMFSSLEKVFNEFVYFLTESCEIPMEQLLIVVHKDDVDLKNQWIDICKQDRSIFLVDGDTWKYKTRWVYGENVPLFGRGITITLENKQVPFCCPECNPLCKCSKYLPMGNVIIVNNELNGSKYIDIGFGIEFLSGLKHNGDLFLIDEFKEVIDSICYLGFDFSLSRKLFNLQRGIYKLIEEGCIPSNRKEGYILRAMIRKSVDIISSTYSINQAWEKYKSILDVFEKKEKSNLILIENEVEKYTNTIQASIKQVKKFLRKTHIKEKSELKVKLKDTFGLPNYISEQIIDNDLT